MAPAPAPSPGAGREPDYDASSGDCKTSTTGSRAPDGCRLHGETHPSAANIIVLAEPLPSRDGFVSAVAVSVVVPTRDRPTSLARCLSAIRAQDDGLDLEVVVVDDGSADPGEVRRVAISWGARVVRTEGRGPATARNAGARTASGEIVLLTDDDCVPRPGWVASLVAAVDRHPDGVVHGRVVPARPTDPLLVANELIVEHLRRETAFAPTSNLGLRRSLLVEHRFDERFPAAAGEDREWCVRVRDAGHELVHEPAAVVAHDPDVRFAVFVRRHVRYGRAARELGRAESVARPGAAGTGFYLRLLQRGFAAGLRPGSAVVLAQAATVVGYLSAGRSAEAPPAGR